MMSQTFVRWLAVLMAQSYRFRFAALGKRARILPPLKIRGGKGIRAASDVRIESFVTLSCASAGCINIGDRCEVASFACLEADNGSIVLGTDCSINLFCLLNGFGGLVIGNSVRIASHCVILSSTHNYDILEIAIFSQGIKKQETRIGDGVWIGAHSVIMGGVSIGEHSIIAAGSVVLENVPPFAVIAGVPARIVRMRK